MNAAIDRYSEWDAAYLLGSLSASERREFEHHLEQCAACSAEVAELAGMPALLAKVPASEASQLLSGGAASEPPATLLPRLVRSARRRRARDLGVAAVGAAAAAAVAAVLLVPLVAPGTTPGTTPGSTPNPVAEALSSETAASTIALRQVAPGPLHARIRLVPKSWGTRIEMHCHYGPTEPSGYTSGASAYYAMWVTDAAGHATQIATWSAGPGSDAEPAGTTSLSVRQIAAVDVRAADSGQVLLRGAP